MPAPQTHFIGPYEQMPSFLHWLDSNWQAVCGWCTGIYLTYRVGKFFTDIVLKVKSVVERFEAAESTLVSVATNHLPHLQIELEKTNATMTSMDQTLKKMYKQQVGDYE